MNKHFDYYIINKFIYEFKSLGIYHKGNYYAWGTIQKYILENAMTNQRKGK